MITIYALNANTPEGKEIVGTRNGNKLTGVASQIQDEYNLNGKPDNEWVKALSGTYLWAEQETLKNAVSKTLE